MDNSSVRRVRMVNNRPSLLLDGEDTLPLICALSDFPGADSRTYQAQKNIAAFRRESASSPAIRTCRWAGTRPLRAITTRSGQSFPMC